YDFHTGSSIGKLTFNAKKKALEVPTLLNFYADIKVFLLQDDMKMGADSPRQQERFDCPVPPAHRRKRIRISMFLQFFQYSDFKKKFILTKFFNKSQSSFFPLQNEGIEM